MSYGPLAAQRGSASFLRRRAAPLGPWGVAGCASVLFAVRDDFCAPSATRSGLIAKRHMAQSQDGPVNVTFRALKRRGSVNPGDKIYMRISRTRPFRHLFVAYAESQDIPLALLSWSFDGIVVRGDQTPADLGLEVGGDVMLVAALRRASLRERPRSPPPRSF